MLRCHCNGWQNEKKSITLMNWCYRRENWKKRHLTLNWLQYFSLSLHNSPAVELFINQNRVEFFFVFPEWKARDVCYCVVNEWHFTHQYILSIVSLINAVSFLNWKYSSYIAKVYGNMCNCTTVTNCHIKFECRSASLKYVE